MSTIPRLKLYAWRGKKGSSPLTKRVHIKFFKLFLYNQVINPQNKSKKPTHSLLIRFQITVTIQEFSTPWILKKIRIGESWIGNLNVAFKCMARPVIVVKRNWIGRFRVRALSHMLRVRCRLVLRGSPKMITRFKNWLATFFSIFFSFGRT